MRPFIVSGMGRSGSMFLAQLCNQSVSHHVVHEWKHGSAEHRQMVFRPEWYLRMVRATLFTEKPMCHVNSYLLYYLDFFSDVAMTAILYRDIREVVLSNLNRRPENQWNPIVKNIVAWYEYYHRTLRGKHMEIPFDIMTTDVDYLQSLLGGLGVTDVEVTEEMMLTKVNEEKKTKFQTYDEVPDKVKKLVDGVIL